MLFNSLIFLYAFLPVAYFVFWKLRGKFARHAWLAVTGYVFYSFWNYKFCALMLASTSISYLAGLGLLRWRDPLRRRLCLVVPVTVDLALLGVFKYANFALASVNDLSSRWGAHWIFPTLDVVLPVGISFYTFHTVTYIVDAYHRRITPTRSFVEFASYVSLFPQLVAGPIVRFRQIEGDLGDVDHAEARADLDTGWSFFAIGFVKKVLVADTIGTIVTPALADIAHLSTLGAWLCALGFSYQIYYDFSGYSDMAVGLGYMFGLRLPQNFDSPYRATDMADFWRRWHISMSSFFRDYVYIPLGGNRVSRPIHYRNLMLTMLVAGLWHGAAWTFVVWGGFIGLLLILHDLIREPWQSLPVWSRRLGTFLLWVVSMTIFRSDSLSMAGDWLARLFSPQVGAIPTGTAVLVPFMLVAGLFAHLGPNTFEMRHRWAPASVGALAFLFGLSMLALYGSSSTPFLYFQF